jgi:hypothetical protein
VVWGWYMCAVICVNQSVISVKHSKVVMAFVFLFSPRQNISGHLGVNIKKKSWKKKILKKK